MGVPKCAGINIYSGLGLMDKGCKSNIVIRCNLDVIRHISDRNTYKVRLEVFNNVIIRGTGLSYRVFVQKLRDTRVLV